MVRPTCHQPPRAHGREERRRHVDAGFPLGAAQIGAKIRSRRCCRDDLPRGAKEVGAARKKWRSPPSRRRPLRRVWIDQIAKGRAPFIALTTLSDNLSAWRRVGLALDRVGFTVVDRDRTAGTYLFRYADPEVVVRNEPGILDKLKFWQSNNKDVVEQYRITVGNAGKSEVRSTTRAANLTALPSVPAS